MPFVNPFLYETPEAKEVRKTERFRATGYARLREMEAQIEREKREEEERRREVEANRQRLIQADRQLFEDKVTPQIQQLAEEADQRSQEYVSFREKEREQRNIARSRFADRAEEDISRMASTDREEYLSFRDREMEQRQSARARFADRAEDDMRSLAEGKTVAPTPSPTPEVGMGRFREAEQELQPPVTQNQVLGQLTRFVERRMEEPGEPHPDPNIREMAKEQLSRSELVRGSPDLTEEERKAARAFFTTLLEGAPASAVSANFPGVVGKIPGFRNPEELAATLGTAGLGAIPATAKAAGVIGGTIGATGGGAGAAAIDPRLRPIGEIAGGLAGGITGASRFMGRQPAATLGSSAEDVAQQARRSGFSDVAEEADAFSREVNQAGVAEEIADPVEKLTAAIRAAPRAVRKTASLRSEELSRRAGAVETRLRGGGSAEQRLRTGFSELRGELPRADIEAIGPQFTQAETENLVSRALDFDFGSNTPFENLRAGAAVQKLFVGELPTDSDLALLERVFGSQFVRAVKSQRPLSQKVWQEAVDIINLPRTVLASMDHSFPGRQGIKLAPSYPKEWGRSWLAGLKAMGRASVADEIDAHLLADNAPFTVEGRTVPFSQIKKNAGLFHASRGEAGSLAEREETFISRWASRIPGVGKLVDMSQRGFITSGNKIRSDVLKRLLTNAETMGREMDWDTVTGYANLLNRATGRGTLGPLNQYAPLLSGLQFAPRFRLSHPQWVAQIANRNPAVRREAAKQLLAFYGSGATILGVLKATDAADVELDPRSTDFGRIRLGNTTIDFWGGMQGQARALARIFGGRKTQTGDIIDTDALDEAFRYFESGLSPQAAIGLDLAQGRNRFTGEPIEPTLESVSDEAFQRLVPIAWQDVIEAAREWGLKGALFAPGPLLGLGVQTYERPAEQLQQAWNEKYAAEFGPYTGEPAQKRILEGDPDLAPILEEIERRRLRFGSEGATTRAEREEFLAQEEQALKIPEIAQELESGNFQAGPTFASAYEELLSTRSAAARRDIFGVELPEAESEVQKQFDKWAEITPQQYLEEGEIDWERFFEDKDAAFEALPKKLRENIEGQLLTTDSTAQSIERRYKQARDALREIYDMSKWRGISKEGSDTLQDFINHVERQTRQLKRELAQQGQDPDSITRTHVARALGQKSKRNSHLAAQALLHWRGDAPLNVERIEKAIDNQDLLTTFFPDIFDSLVPTEIERSDALSEESFERINQ